MGDKMQMRQLVLSSSEKIHAVTRAKKLITMILLVVFALVCELSATVQLPAAEPVSPQPMRRADSFLGIHFDFHAGADCEQVGARTTAEMVKHVIDKVRPDYIQIDCKGHRGYSSYPTQVGNPVPGFVGDPLRIWREVTRERGVALFMHYSGSGRTGGRVASFVGRIARRKAVSRSQRNDVGLRSVCR